MSAIASSEPPTDRPRLRFGSRLAASGLDGVTLLVLPAALFLVALFVYPFLYGFILSFEPKAGGGIFANYQRFFSDHLFLEHHRDHDADRVAGDDPQSGCSPSRSPSGCG